MKKVTRRKMSMYIVTIFCVLLLIAFLSIGFFLKMQQSKDISTITSDWKTYTSLSYSFKYPSASGWQIQEFTNPSSVRLSCPNCKNISFVWFTVAPIGPSTLDTYKKSGFYAFLTETKEVNISGYPAIKGVFPGGPPGGLAQIIYFVVRRGLGYEITYHYSLINKSKFSDYPAPTPDILSTFRFRD